jgi:hypothetical protein
MFVPYSKIKSMIKKNLLTSLAVGSALMISTSLFAQLNGTYTIPGSYPSVAAIVADLNTQGISGPVTINIAAGYTENVPSGGIILTASGTAANPIIFQKSGVGANPKLIASYAGTGTPGSAVQDGIFALVGSDYVTIDGIDLEDMNSSNPATMEYGYGFFKASATNGCQHNTIKNCVIKLSNVNNATSTGPSQNGSKGISFYNATNTAMSTALTITAPSGSHSNNKIYSNTITNCNVGISFYGYNDSSPYANVDMNNDIGGNSPSTGNTIINFGGGGTNTSYGIYAIYQWNLNVSNNILNNNPTNSISNHTGIFYGIMISSANNANLSILNNTVTIQSGSSTNQMACIYSLAGGSGTTNTVVISGNVISSKYTTATTGTYYGIYNGATAANLFINNNLISGHTYGNGTSSGHNYMIYNLSAISNSLTINSNTITNVNYNGTFSLYLCYNSNVTQSYSFNNNLISNITRTPSASGTIYGFYNAGSPSGGTVSLSSNTITAVSQGTTVSNTFYGFYHTTLSSQNVNCTNNIISNIQSGTGSNYGIYITYGNIVNISNNNINNITHAGPFAGIFGGTISTYTISAVNNTITSVNLFGASSTEYGIYLGANLTGASNQCIKNTIGNITHNGTGGSLRGIQVTSASDNQIVNNIVGDLKTPNISSASGLYGIYVNSGTSVKLYYNTVRLNAVSSGNPFGSSAVYTSTVSTNIYCANNIFINNSTPVGTGLTKAYERNGTSLSNFTSPTDNNIYYAGNPGPSNLIFYDGTNAIQNLGAYQTHVSPHEANSKTENTTFISTTGGSSGFLHVQPTVYSLSNNGATNISGIIDDIDGDIRAGNPGYAGTGFAPDIGADEYEPVLPACSGTPNAGTVMASTNLLCNGGSAVLTNTSATTGSGITYQWQVSNTGVSGPYSSIPSATLLSYTTPTLLTGVYYYQLVVTCTASALSSTTTPISITVNPVPTATAGIVGSNTVCLGSPINLTGGTDIGISFTWSGPNGFTSSVQNPTISTSTFSSTGTYTFVATAANCSSNPSTVNVVVYSFPGGVVTPSVIQHCGASAGDTLTISNFNYQPSYSCGLSTGPCVGPTTLIPVGVANYTNSTTGYPSVYGHLFKNARHQILFKASEILAAGLQPGKISSMSFSVVSIPSGYQGYVPGFQISMKCVPSTFTSVSTTFDNSGFTTVYGPVTYSPVVGWNTHSFPVPYEWDGTSNLLVDVCYTLDVTPPYSNNPVMSATTLTYNAVVYYRSDSNPACGTTLAGIISSNRPDVRFENCVAEDPSTFTYSWSPSTGLSSTNTMSTIASPTSSTIYTVTIDNGHCTSVSTATINIFPNPTISVVSSNNPSCEGSNVTLTASGANTYTWNTGATTNTIVDNPTSTTTYTVDGIDANGCSASVTFTQNVNPNPTISVVSSNTLSCSGSNITLTSSGANTYTWNTGATTNTIVDNPTSTTTYTVDGTDANGCSASVTYTQNVVSNPTITTVNVTDATSPGCANGSATVNVTGGTSPYIYTWNPNVSSSNIATNLNGTSGTGTSYTVTVVDVNSCSSVYTFTVDCVTGIESIQVNSGIAIYPNPTNGQFNVVFDANLGEQMEMELTDVTGKTVLHIISREAVTPVNISELANGIYFYTIKVEGVKVRGKVVKE